MLLGTDVALDTREVTVACPHPSRSDRFFDVEEDRVSPVVGEFVAVQEDSVDQEDRPSRRGQPLALDRLIAGRSCAARRYLPEPPGRSGSSRSARNSL